MSGVSLSPMHIVTIYRTRWAIPKIYITGGNEKKTLEGKNTRIKSTKTSKQMAFVPS